MKKWNKRYAILIGSLFAVIVVSNFFVHILKIEFTIANIKLLETIINLSVIMIIIFTLICGIAACLGIIRRGVHNVRVCEVEIFSNLDLYKKGTGQSDAYYLKQIEIINLYYREGGKIDQLVKDREINKLFIRMDYLNNQISLFDDMTTYTYSLALSVIASLICQMMNAKNMLLLYVQVALILLSFLTIILAKYVERGQAGSYRHMIDEYERKLLTKKMDMLFGEMEAKGEDEEFLRTKQIVINELLNIKKTKKSKCVKKEVDQDIQCVENLKLHLEDYSASQKRKISIKGQECYLLYDREKGLTNNYIGEFNLITQDYSVLYKILAKYNLIEF